MKPIRVDYKRNSFLLLEASNYYNYAGMVNLISYPLTLVRCALRHYILNSLLYGDNSYVIVKLQWEKVVNTSSVEREKESIWRKMALSDQEKIRLYLTSRNWSLRWTLNNTNSSHYYIAIFTIKYLLFICIYNFYIYKKFGYIQLYS